MYLQPKTELERTILAHPVVITGLMYGEPRPGHPEGKVWLHVQEIWNLIPNDNEALRFLALLHDAFKFMVSPNRPKIGDNHHGWYARVFAKAYIEHFGTIAQDILETLQWHDEPYHIWRSVKKSKTQSQQRWQHLMTLPIVDWNLFLEFVKLDSKTGDKDNAWFSLFENELKKEKKLF